MINVLHYVYQYLPLTCGWVYSQIIQTPGVVPYVVTNRPPLNEELFPSITPTVLPLSFYTDRGLASVVSLFKLRFAQYRRYVELVDRLGIDVVHAHFGAEGCVMSQLLAATSVPLVVSFYGYDYGLPKASTRYRLLYPSLFSRGNMFLVEGPAARDNLKAIGCPEEKIRIQHIGVNLNTYRYVERKPKQDGTIRILMAATFKEKKGLNYGLKAFSAAYRELPMLRLTVIGDGPMKEELLRIADDEKISSVITWFGYVEHEELLRHMMDCHIFMQPSVTASDGDTEG
ncbi:MAG: glycosyltransferase, partial [Syntrophorhabdales bacterium]